MIAPLTAYSGNSKDSRNVWNSTYSDAQKVAYNQAIYECKRRGLNIRAYIFDANGGNTRALCIRIVQIRPIKKV